MKQRMSTANIKEDYCNKINQVLCERLNKTTASRGRGFGRGVAGTMRLARRQRDVARCAQKGEAEAQ